MGKFVKKYIKKIELEKLLGNIICNYFFIYIILWNVMYFADKYGRTLSLFVRYVI